jgi:hypothetical protein
VAFVVVLSVALVAYNAALNLVPFPRWTYGPANLALAAALVAAARARGLSWEALGLDPAHLGQSLRWGLGAAAVIGAAITVGVVGGGPPAPPALLEIDLQGARQVRETMPEALFVFLKPPSWEELVRRLVGRGTEDEEERARRLGTAQAELAAESEFDVTIVNHEVPAAATELVALMRFGTDQVPDRD